MYQWEILSKYQAKESILEQLLASRGIITKNEKEQFINPPPFNYWFERLPKELLKSLKHARELLIEAMKAQRTIIIHGDYDADGVCATAILYKTLKYELGYENVFPFMPNRFEHGYGFSERSIDKVLEMSGLKKTKQSALFVTVDCGITSKAEVDILKKLGHEVIITDHHQKPDGLPRADVIVWYDQVVGAALAYLLSRVMGGKSKEYLALVSIATVTDLQPVLGFNRTFVKDGLEIINSKPPQGVKHLLEVAGKVGQEVTAYDLGWLIGPRLNATGRVEDARKALDLLTEENETKVKELAWELNRVNSLRQDKTIEMFELAAELEDGDLPKVIISLHDNYHEGIIGLVASRLAQKYHRPAVVISTAQEMCKGSARSIKGLNIIEALRSLDANLFISLGGHPMAAGFSMERSQIDKFVKKLTEFVDRYLDDKALIKTLEIDMEIPPSIINKQTVAQLDKLKPYGIGNSTPVFCSTGFSVSGTNIIGSQKQHLALRLYDGQNFYRAIYFNFRDHFKEEVKVGDKIEAAYNLKVNEYRDQETVELVLKDIKITG